MDIDQEMFFALIGSEVRNKLLAGLSVEPTSYVGAEAAPVQPDFFCSASHSMEPGAHVGSARPDVPRWRCPYRPRRIQRVIAAARTMAATPRPATHHRRAG